MIIKEDSLKKRYFIKLFSNAATVVIGSLMVALVPKALGPNAYGIFTYLNQFFSQIINFFEIGSSTAFFTKLSARHDRKELITFYFLYLFILLSGLLAFLYVVHHLGISHKIFGNIGQRFIIFGAIFGFFTWIIQICIKISDAYAQTVAVEIIKIVHKMVSLLTLVIIVQFNKITLDTYYYFQLMFLVLLIAALCALFIRRGIFTKGLLTLELKFKELSLEFLQFCTPIFVYSSVAIGFDLFDTWSLQRLGGSSQVGYYGLSMAIVGMTFMFTSAITPLIAREFSKSYANRDFEMIRRLFSRYVPMLYSITAYFAVFISFQSATLIRLFADQRFEYAIPVLTILSFYSIHQVYGQISGGLFYAADQVKTLRNTNVFASLLGFLLTIVFLYMMPIQPAIGFAIKMLVLQIIHVNVQLYFNTRFLNLSLSKFIFHQIYSIAVFTVIAGSVSYFSYSPYLMLNFIVTGGIYTGLSALAAFCFPVIFSTSRSEIRTMLTNLRRKTKYV